MTISSDVRKAGPFSGNDSTTIFPFTFKCFTSADLLVIFTSNLGVESTLVLDSDYTVTLNLDQNANPGGNVTYSLLATGELLTILGNVNYRQETDIQNQGGFYPEVIEEALDKLTMQTQQLREEVGRAVKVSVSGSLDPDGFLSAIAQSVADASTSASQSASSATDSLNSANLAGKWAEEAEDVPVEGGKFSAKHWAAKAEALGGDKLSINGGSMTGAINEKRATVAATATTTPLWTAANGNVQDWIGTPTITDFPDAPQAGASRVVYPAAGTRLVCSSDLQIVGLNVGESYLTQSNDKIDIQAITTSSFRVRIEQPILNYPSSFKNKLIGGDFTTNPWQRGTSFAAIGSDAYSADRWVYGLSGTAVVSALKTADAPTATQAGIFTQHCLHVDVTTADAAIEAGDQYFVGQRVEGLNAASFGFGQAGTRNVTISFWHKHTKTGVNCVAIRNGASDRSYVGEYTQDVADTWERAEITIPVDTTGTWLYDTGIGLNITFALAAGTNFQTAANTWAAGNFVATANQVNNLDSTANDFKLALIQLEAGSTATAFETRSIGQEMALCQRYFYAVNNSYGWTWYGEAAGRGTPVWHNFPVTMRATPTTTSAYSEGVNTGTPIFNLSPTQFFAFIGTAAAGGASATLTISTFIVEI